MVLTIAACDAATKVDDCILGRADIRLRFASRICCALPTSCGYMCAHSGLMVMMAMVMTMMMMLSVMVIIELEALRQVGWLR
jgi:hypothetical protein